MRITDVLKTVLPVVIMLVTGMICRRRKLISREGIHALKRVVVDITLPAMLLGAFASTEYTFMDVVIPLMMYVVCFAGWGLGKLFKKLLRLDSRFVPYLTTGFEAGMLGYALFTMLSGGGRTAEFARIDLGQVLFVFTAYKILLGMEGDEAVDRGALIREMLLSPIIIAIAAGVLLGAKSRDPPVRDHDGSPRSISCCPRAVLSAGGSRHGGECDVHPAAAICFARICGRRGPEGLCLLGAVIVHSRCHRGVCGSLRDRIAGGMTG